jgi:hypothetical protein
MAQNVTYSVSISSCGFVLVIHEFPLKLSKHSIALVLTTTIFSEHNSGGETTRETVDATPYYIHIQYQHSHIFKCL